MAFRSMDCLGVVALIKRCIKPTKKTGALRQPNALQPRRVSVRPSQNKKVAVQSQRQVTTIRAIANREANSGLRNRIAKPTGPGNKRILPEMKAVRREMKKLLFRFVWWRNFSADHFPCADQI
jgi:hypothetical protein